jgi:hypothetical protein
MTTTNLHLLPVGTYQAVLDAVTFEMAREGISDEFACLETHNCVSPGGHVFLNHGTEEVCLHCRRVTWRR